MFLWVRLPAWAAPDAAMAGGEEWVDGIPESSSPSPWREVAAGNCLLSAGTEGCGYQLLRAVKAETWMHRSIVVPAHTPCTCSVLQPPLDTKSSLWSTLWLSNTGEDSPEAAGQILVLSLVLRKAGTCCSVSVVWVNQRPWVCSQTRHRSGTEIFVPHLPQQSCGCWLEWQGNRGLGCHSPKSLKPWLDGWDLEHS